MFNIINYFFTDYYSIICILTSTCFSILKKKTVSFFLRHTIVLLSYCCVVIIIINMVTAKDRENDKITSVFLYKMNQNHYDHD